MDNIQVFPSEEFGEIRTVTIKGTEYFFGVDVATALQYKRPRWAITTHCKGVITHDSLKNGGNYPEPLIPIGDIYRLIVKASSQSNNEEIKEKAERFERLVFDTILPEIHKTGGYGAPKTVPEQIQLLAQGNVELNQRVDGIEKETLYNKEEIQSVKEELEKFKSDVPAFNADTKDIQNALRKKAIEVLGGKDSNAYHDNSVRGYAFADIQIELRRQFGVKRYDQIRHKDVPDALKVIEEYKPPIHIKDKIEMANAQQTLDLEGGAAE